MSDRKLFAWGIGLQIAAVLLIWMIWLVQAWVELMFS